jgi:hypothetical protein
MLSNSNPSIFKVSPLYYNINITAGYRQQANQSVIAPAFLNELNSQVVLNNSSNYFCSVVRASIPTNYVPLLIVPIVDGIAQADINKCIYSVSFYYIGADGTTIILRKNANITYQPEFYPAIAQNDQAPYQLPKPPSDYNGVQDVRGNYYYIYNIFQIVKFYQDSINLLWADFASDPLVGLNPDTPPILTYNNATQLFSMNYPKSVKFQSKFGTLDPPSSFVLMTVDSLSVDTFNFSALIVPRPLRPFPSDGYIMQVIDNFNNTVKLSGTGDELFTQMEACQSNLNMWGALTKIIFSVSYGISSKQEYDTISSSFGTNTNQQNIQKPIYSYLADLEVNRDEFARNRNFIQFNNGGSITQSRLIELTGQQIQNFQLSVKWVDVFGNINDLDIPDGQPLSIKLGFFGKETSII